MQKPQLLLHQRYSRASPMAQQVRKLPAMQEMQVWALGWGDPWRRAWQPTPVFLLGKSHGQRRLLGPLGTKGPDMTWATEHKWYSKKRRYFGETTLILLERNMNFGDSKIKENILTLLLTVKSQIWKEQKQYYFFLLLFFVFHRTTVKN